MLLFVHQPDTSAVDRAHVDFQIARQAHGIDLLVTVGRQLIERRGRVDMASLGRANADEGAESAKRFVAGVLDDGSIAMHANS